jgi:hypothetical protein
VALFVLPCGVLWASGACGSALGYHGRPLFFPWSVPVPETRFSVELGLCPCSLRMRLEGPAGGSCLSLLWRAAGSVQSPASLPHIHQVEGIYQVSFPCQGRYSPVTRPVTLVDDGGGVDGSKTVSSGRCSSESGAVLGVSSCVWGPLGCLLDSFREKGLPPGCPGSPLAPPWGLGSAGPCGGPWAVSIFSLSWPDPVFHLVPPILGRIQISFSSSRCILSPSSSGAFCIP